MSDGITDAYRDMERSKVTNKIIKLEIRLLDEKATRSDIETLIKLWEEYKSLPRGYWTSSDREVARRRIDKYKWMLNSGMLNITLKEE